MHVAIRLECVTSRPYQSVSWQSYASTSYSAVEPANSTRRIPISCSKGPVRSQVGAHQARSRNIVKRHSRLETVWEVACLNDLCSMFLSRRVASGRSGECASEWNLTIDGPKYEGLSFDCGGYILLLSYMLLRVQSSCVVASASQRV